MKAPHPIDALVQISRGFGPDAAARKTEILSLVEREKPAGARRLRELHGLLRFMEAYPDSPEVLAQVRELRVSLEGMVNRRTRGDAADEAFLNTGLPGTINTYPFSYAVLQRLAKLEPGCLEFDWDAIEDVTQISNALCLAVLPAEVRGLDDERISLPDWLEGCKESSEETCLEAALRLLERSPLTPRQRSHVFESCELPIRLELRGGRPHRLPRSRIHYQKRPLHREQFPLEPRIRRPLPGCRRLSPRKGRELIDLSLATLCERNLEIYPLIHANPRDVTLVECGRGFQVAMVGVLEEFRTIPESLYFFLILKNGIPAAYGPTAVFLGQCEMGINLFPEFRGGESRFLYAQLMRTLYHLAHVRTFSIVPYGMGEENEEALRSGAFWFYRKLGFRASNPAVESLAVAEEARMSRDRNYRSSVKTLRRLSHTSAYFEVSGGSRRRIDFPELGRAVTRTIQDRFGGNRTQAERTSMRRVSRSLGIRDLRSWNRSEKEALRRLAPLIALLPDVETWPGGQKRLLAAAIKARGGSHEFGYVDRIHRLPRLEAGFHELTRA